MTFRSRVWCGVDLGSERNPGAIAFICIDDGVLVAEAMDLPLDGKLLLNELNLWQPSHLEFEEPIIMGKKTSKKTHGAMRESRGRLMACLEIFSDLCSREGVRPAQWKKKIFEGEARESGRAGKIQSIKKAQQLFPGVELSNDDQAEALLIAEYGRRLHG